MTNGVVITILISRNVLREENDMETIQIITSISTIIANMAIIASMTIALFQLFIMKKTFLEEHTRNLRKGTIEFYNEINKETCGLIDDVILNKVNLDLENINNDVDLHKRVRRYLSLMERFSVGINSHMYDIKTFDRLQGKTTLIMYKALKPYIDSISEKYGTYFYGEFLSLINNINTIREQRRNSGYSKQTEDFSKYEKISNK